jgi:hypothetical protein
MQPLAVTTVASTGIVEWWSNGWMHSKPSPPALPSSNTPFRSRALYLLEQTANPWVLNVTVTRRGRQSIGRAFSQASGYLLYRLRNRHHR